MKKHILALLVLVLIGTSITACGRKRVIDPEQLPKAATELVQKHWPSCVIDFAYIDGLEYEVLLSDGTIIEFNKKGEWKEMNIYPAFFKNITNMIKPVSPKGNQS